MKWVILAVAVVLVFAGVGGYILYARGLFGPQTSSTVESEAGKQESQPKERHGETAGLTESILKRDQELRETAARLEELTARLETERRELEAERSLVEQKIQELKLQEEKLKALRQKPVAKPEPPPKRKPEPVRLPTPSEDMLKLVKVYEAMPPEDAAPVLENLPDTATAQILLQMRRRQASQIMGLLTPDKAASVSKLLTAQTVAVEPVE
ncbi:MAG: hypothetical protein HY801_06765 [Candidatus Lindowbacteria bacterium]|nr:hypothetical protein [Candidatus Lindowbacteria bacterium]